MKVTILILHWLYPVFLGMLYGMLALIIHEFGHLLAAKLLGLKVKSFAVSWKGMGIVREAGPPTKNLLVSIAGPLVNAVVALIWHWSPTFGLANVCFAFFNILPIKGADGDRALRCWERWEETKT